MIELLLVRENIAVTSITIVHIHNGLVGILHRALLNPRLDTLSSSQLQHLPNLIRAADQRTAELEALHDEHEGRDLKSAILGGTELNEGTVDTQKSTVLDNRHLGRGGSGDDQVKRASVAGSPVLILTGSDEVIRTELQCILLLIGLAGDGDNAISTERLGEQNSKVTETTNANDTNGLSGAAAVPLKRRVGSNTTAEHRRRISRGDSIRDLDHEVRGRAVVCGVTTVRLATVGIDTVVRANHLIAVLFETRGTRFTVAILVLARAALRADTDTITDLNISLSLGSDADGSSDDLVANTARVVGGALWKQKDGN